MKRPAMRIMTMVAVLGLTTGLAVAGARASTGRAAPAHGSTTSVPGLTPLMAKRMMAQIPLDEAATRIQDAAAALGARHDGFFQTAVNDDRHILTVYWRGAVPGKIGRLIRSLAGPRVHISVVSTTYDLAQLTKALLKASHVPGFSSGAPMHNGSGINVILAASAPAAAFPRLGVPVHVARTAQRGRFAFTCAAGFPNVTQPALPAPSRCDDREPGFWGGDVIINNTAGAGCSTAFGAHDSRGNGYMVTAAHCSVKVVDTPPVNGIKFTNGDGTQTMGSSIDAPGPHDAALIPTSSGNRYYDGAGIENGDTHNTKLVVNQLGTSLHDFLCESGGWGGVRCSLQVTDTNAMESDGHLTFTGVAYASGPFVTDGDSGGPWFALASQPGTVSARGVTSGIFQSPSNGNFEDTFTPITTVTQDTGVSVNTG